MRARPDDGSGRARTKARRRRRTPARIAADAPRPATIAEVVKAAIAAEPRLEPRIYKDGKLFVGVFVNDRNMRALGGFEAPVSDGDVLRVMPPIAGG